MTSPNYIGNGFYVGTSSDTKPTTGPVGSVMYETDTGTQHMYIGTTWVKISEQLGVPVHPGLKKTGSFQPINGVNGGSGFMQGAPIAIVVGTGATTGLIRSVGGMRMRYTTGATGNSITGLRMSTGVNSFERDLNPRMDMKVLLSQTTTNRCFLGFREGTTNPASAADPLANLSGVAFFYDSAVDSNWHIMQNNGAASSDSTTIANIAAADTNAHVFSLRAVELGSKFQYAYGSTPPKASTTWTDISTKIPTATTGINGYWYMENLSGTTTFEIFYIYIEQDA